MRIGRAVVVAGLVLIITAAFGAAGAAQETVNVAVRAGATST